MDKKPSTGGHSFRFRTGKGQWLTDEIARIEALATERLRAGVSYHSVQTGALALLNVVLGGVSGEAVESVAEPKPIQTCVTVSESPQCGTL